MEPLSDWGEFSGELDNLLGYDTSPEGAQGGDVGTSVPGDILDEVLVKLLDSDHTLNSHGFVGFVDLDGIVVNLLGVLLVVEFGELEVVILDELEQSLETEVQLFWVAELFPVTEVHAISVAGWDRVGERILKASGGARDLGLDLLNDTLSGVGVEFCGVAFDSEGVGGLDLDGELFSVDLFHSLDLSETNEVTITESVSLGIVDGDEGWVLLGDEGDHGILELFSVLIKDDVLITEVNEGESVESETSVVDETLVFGSEEIIPLDELINIVVVGEDSEAHLAEERLIDGTLPD